MTIQSTKGGQISRSFNPGIWVWLSKCDNKWALDVKLGRVQIDNQLNNYEMPTRVVFSSKELTYVDTSQGTHHVSSLQVHVYTTLNLQLVLKCLLRMYSNGISNNTCSINKIVIIDIIIVRSIATAPFVEFCMAIDCQDKNAIREFE